MGGVDVLQVRSNDAGRVFASHNMLPVSGSQRGQQVQGAKHMLVKLLFNK